MSIICRERLWGKGSDFQRFIRRSRNLVFCLLLLYYMLKIWFSEYYLYSILIPYFLHHKSHLIWRFTIRPITSSRESTKKDVHTTSLPKNFIFLSINYIALFSSLMQLKLQYKSCWYSESKKSIVLCLPISGHLICQHMCMQMDSYYRGQQNIACGANLTYHLFL